MAMVGSAEKPEVPGISTTAKRIGQDVVYLYQMS